MLFTWRVSQSGDKKKHWKPARTISLRPKTDVDFLFFFQGKDLGKRKPWSSPSCNLQVPPPFQINDKSTNIFIFDVHHYQNKNQGSGLCRLCPVWPLCSIVAACARPQVCYWTWCFCYWLCWCCCCYCCCLSHPSKPHFRQDSRLPVTKDLLRFAQVFSQMIKVKTNGLSQLVFEPFWFCPRLHWVHFGLCEDKAWN